MLELAHPRSILACERVVSAVGECLQGKERVSRAAAAEVDLEGVRLPQPVASDGDEVDARAPDHPFACQAPSDLEPLGCDSLGVLLIGGEMAAEVRVPVRPAQHLVVRRHDVHLADRAHPELSARAAEQLSFDALLDDPALLVEH